MRRLQQPIRAEHPTSTPTCLETPLTLPTPPSFFFPPVAAILPPLYLIDLLFFVYSWAAVNLSLTRDPLISVIAGS
jgi:hypothetical protein